jgi:hypothetical protein
MLMTASKLGPEEEAFFEQIDALVDDGISAMSPAEFRRYVKKSNNTIAEIKRRACECAESSETPQQERRVSQA